MIFWSSGLAIISTAAPRVHACTVTKNSQEVLGDLPQKTFTDNSVPTVCKPLVVPPPAAGGKGASMEALDRVLRLLQVGSKRFLTNKVCLA